MNTDEEMGVSIVYTDRAIRLSDGVLFFSTGAAKHHIRDLFLLAFPR